jgi:hypothetical protein
MTHQPCKSKTILIIAIIVLITLNLYSFIAAYPETYTPSPGINTQGTILAKDFSAYYVSTWRLWHNPSQVYHFGTLRGAEPATPPYPEAYKYLPNFLLFTSPFLLLSYQQALLAFDIVQFILLSAVAFILYKLLENKQLAVTLVVMVIALLLPIPTSSQAGWFPSYYWQWGEGQAKVFLTTLLLFSFFLGSRNRPIFSGIALAFGFFDVRFGLLAIPLFIMYNRKNLKTATVSAIGALILSNLMLLYPGMGSGFITMVVGSGITTPIYYYSYIPLFTLLAFTFVNFKELVAALDYKGVFANFTGASKQQNMS